MKIKTLKLSLLLLIVFSIFISCKDDDEGITTVEVEDRTEQQVKDNDSILLYLTTHYYNSGFFTTGTNHKYTDIEITELEVDENGEYLPMPNPSENTMLIDAVDSYTTTYLEADYVYYVLNINQGGGMAPKFTDEVRVRYEGSSINNDNDVFDVISTPEELALFGDGFTTFGTIRAWQLVMPLFNTADSFGFDNGSITYNNFGLGIMFIPSGLGYFSGTSTGYSYDNLMFKFEMLQYEIKDHDNDGIPSYLEDLDNDTDVFDDDTDEDDFPNYIDFDDDADGVNTFNELLSTYYTVDTNIGEEEPVYGVGEYEYDRSVTGGVITIKTVTVMDSNSDGIPDYLDESIAIDYNAE
ncbi:hypothetical protein HNV08_15330 [Winogradskyella eckloniae]|uniref:FKBP-type peptidyl-prolyl cis-trans isomerase n=1 Tax=Winogradskyella eckloniae TaxID=1089306 RepID=UPI001566014D|nr:hypothetical protein [Winogradskyella eckloniae]NRD21426.1 hypothetical protein [Winogradskyella eckloniae]